ncbi:phosphate ABC transporter permease PstA [Pseudofulvimonas gallinarii]|jgi:phosphate transport system permease protein|uniref:Phosphate transport system permease protein PstA n=1 Tax=Pseudofulvimonas gallinarii TaxID=634155 RepID=A0A4R3LFG4_9GAMM|nr:phosphate ABC transporter permease PstA [Pseudofulvimonas gallinarii]TCS98823.1 phosphate ABC transporter membrane protein 2 (PhoT family) [Pseudofulvimonas gallinarii]THD14307.1 phosphate ABC transporter, permease protein PstA [Pseudofulvimonas gallinarii]
MEPGTHDLRVLIGRQRLCDVLFEGLGAFMLLMSLFILAALFINLAIEGLARLQPDFFLDFPSRRAGQAGILSAWVGSVLVMLVTAAAALPVGVAAGIWLEEYAPKNWLTDVVEINVTNLAGVPSIIYGLLALGLLVHQFRLGESILTAGLTLGMMILPVVIVSTREAIRAVPQTIREAAYGLGASRWRVTRDHVLPYSVAGILTGVIIGLSRAIGETAPIITIGALTFIAFLPPAPVSAVPPFINFEWLSSPFTVLPIQMFNWISRPDPAFQSNAAAAGLVLVILTLFMNAMAIWLRYRARKRIKW